MNSEHMYSSDAWMCDKEEGVFRSLPVPYFALEELVNEEKEAGVKTPRHINLSIEAVNLILKIVEAQLSRIVKKKVELRIDNSFSVVNPYRELLYLKIRMSEDMDKLCDGWNKRSARTLVKMARGG